MLMCTIHDVIHLLKAQVAERGGGRGRGTFAAADAFEGRSGASHALVRCQT